MEHRLYHVDAFTSRLFAGNPAAVVPFEAWPTDDVLQRIAAENNLSETAFFVPSPKPGRFHLRWFTPSTEMDLCGHATLAAAHALWNEMGERAVELIFYSRSGELPVSRDDDKIVLDFPARPGEPASISAELVAALRRRPAEVYKARDLMCVFENKRDVHELAPDFEALARLDSLGVIVTAPGAGHDFISRFFAPAAGVPEDPVTGSAHCTLIPYWAKRLNKAHLTAHQVSKRGGELFCTDHGSRVHIAGRAVTYLRGHITL